jgi:signal peptidase II
MSIRQKPKQQSNWQTAIPLIIVAIPVLILDWGSKWLVQNHIQITEVIPIIPGFFNLRHDRNTGAAFGVLAGHRILLILITIAALVFIFAYYLRFRESRWMQVSLGFLLGGAIGNFIDRIRLGEVVDFLQFGIASQGLFWPTFNFADVSVCIGAGMLIVYLFRNRNDSYQT